MKRKPALLDTKPRKQFFYQTAFTQSFSYLTSGVFLTGLANLMNANDIVLSYLSIILNICGVLILFLSPLVNRFKSYKRMALTLTALSKLFTLLIVLIPLVFPPSARLGVFIAVVIVAFTLQAQTTVAVNQWMLHFIDEEKKGRYLSLRQTLLMAVTVVLSLASGYWLDYSNRAYFGYAVIFAFAAAAGVTELLLLARIPDALLARPSAQKTKLRDSFLLPLKDKKYFGFVVYVVFFYLFLYISDSFTMLYMMNYLKLPTTTTNVLYMLISLPQIVMLGVWGKIGDKRGAKFVLSASFWLFAGETLLMFFASPAGWPIFIPIAFTVAAVANAAFSVSVFNRRYELMPKENRIAYDNFFSAAIGVGFILGPLIGNAFKSLFESTSVIAGSMPHAGIRLLYIISTVGLLLLQIVHMILQRNTKETCNVGTVCPTCPR